MADDPMQEDVRKIDAAIRKKNFPLKCEASEQKGRMLNATRAFREGEVIVREKPLHLAIEADAAHPWYRELRAMHTKNELDFEPLWYWGAICSLTGPELRPRPDAAASSWAVASPSATPKPVTPEVQEHILMLFAPENAPSDSTRKILQRAGIAASPERLEMLLQIWVHNCFEHQDEPLAYSMYFIPSFLSHSCAPNAIWHEADGDWVLIARKDIPQGTEVEISYLSEEDLFAAQHSRQKKLKETKGFTCGCERCVADAQQDPSRGVRCACGGTAFLRGDLLPSQTKAPDAVCTTCGKHVSGKQALEWEVQAKRLSKAPGPPKGNEEQLLSHGAQHWLVHKSVKGLMRGQPAEKKAALYRYRVLFELAVYRRTSSAQLTLEDALRAPVPNAQFAWDLESLANHVDFPTQVRLLECAIQILGLLFGAKHEFAEKVRSSLERRRKRAAAANGAGAAPMSEDGTESE